MTLRPSTVERYWATGANRVTPSFSLSRGGAVNTSAPGAAGGVVAPFVATLLIDAVPIGTPGVRGWTLSNAYSAGDRPANRRKPAAISQDGLGGMATLLARFRGSTGI